ncbi:unnamed protein product [Alternaria alternata]
MASSSNSDSSQDDLEERQRLVRRAEREQYERNQRRAKRALNEVRKERKQEQERIKNLRKEQMEENLDSDTVVALRGYAPLSHDATTAEGLEWKHLKHESNQEPPEHPNINQNDQDSDDDAGITIIRRYSDSDSTESLGTSKLQPKKQPRKQRRPVPQRATVSGTNRRHNLKDIGVLEDALDEIKALRMENERLRQAARLPSAPSQPVYSSKVFYRVGAVLYLDEPRWEPAEGSSVRLLANSPIRNLERYLDQHPEISFSICKEYAQDVVHDCSEIETIDGIYRPPTPTHEVLSLVGPDMQDAVEELVQLVPRFSDYFPHFDPDERIPAPYLFMYYSTPFIPGILPKLGARNRNLITQLQAVIAESYGHEYKSAKLQADKGMIARKHLKYLIRPGDVLVSTASDGNILQACIARGWTKASEIIREDTESEEWDQMQDRRIKEHDPPINPKSSRKMTTYVWRVPVWYWSFDGNFGRHETSTDIIMSLASEEDSVEIRSLNSYPLQYARAETRSLLEKRGKTFWSLRNRRFVSYMRSEEDELYKIEDRYIVDTKSFKMLFPDSNIAQMRLKNAFSATAMANDQPPEDDDALLVVPTTIMAHNLQEKNKQAFEDLVAEPETKELVQALVMRQINARRSTEFVAGKGNGLIMLLHGAPGTGKTFTAEGVAEFAEKPLLRITCGDIGTEPEVVDQRLRATLRLGKVWDCVVLLDEADVFLEERDMKDLKRNALVSVFLRALEYYDGILILTSNRVGTFDEAFKSRIQLALHYDNLGIVQRKKIWRNFITRMKTLEESSTKDLEDIVDHIDELSKEPMNGREIRNSITIARQLAQFRNKSSFQYSDLKDAMKVGSRFSKYLKDLRMNYTDDMIKQDSGIRYSYTATPAGLE